MSLLGALGLVIGPFGNIGDHLQNQPTWTDFHSDGAVMVVGRAEMIDPPQTPVDRISGALARGVDHLPYGNKLALEPDAFHIAWGKLTKSETEVIRGCDDFPCKVKLNRAESMALKNSPRKDRLESYLDLIRSRVEKYVTTGERLIYETEKEMDDPWAWLNQAGWPRLPDVGIPARISARKMDLLPDRLRPVRQILDRRISDASSSRPGFDWEMETWVRAVYTNHYFDDWAEWIYVASPESGKKIVLIHILLVELDLLKKRGLFARLARPRMKNAVKDLGQHYLDEAATELKKAIRPD